MSAVGCGYCLLRETSAADPQQTFVVNLTLPSLELRRGFRHAVHDMKILKGRADDTDSNLEKSDQFL